MIYSHTIVRQGQPFIERVLRNVEPYMDRMLVTVSERSTDGTKEILSNLQSEWKGKLVVDTENVVHPSELTKERQKQLDQTPMGAWVLFLDDDDWWTNEELADMVPYLKFDVDGYGVMPWQLMSINTYDGNFKNKYFTKWFKKQEGVHYEHPWPRDLIYKGKDMLYWKTNPRVPKIPVKFFHLSYLKNHSFREENWAREFANKLGNPVTLPDYELNNARRIFESNK